MSIQSIMSTAADLFSRFVGVNSSNNAQTSTGTATAAPTSQAQPDPPMVTIPREQLVNLHSGLMGAAQAGQQIFAILQNLFPQIQPLLTYLNQVLQPQEPSAAQPGQAQGHQQAPVQQLSPAQQQVSAQYTVNMSAAGANGEAHTVAQAPNNAAFMTNATPSEPVMSNSTLPPQPQQAGPTQAELQQVVAAVS